MNLNKEANLKLIVRNTGASDALNVEIQDELPEGLQYISSVPEMVCTAEVTPELQNCHTSGRFRQGHQRECEANQDGAVRACRDREVRDRLPVSRPACSSPS